MPASRIITSKRVPSSVDGKGVVAHALSSVSVAVLIEKILGIKNFTRHNASSEAWVSGAYSQITAGYLSTTTKPSATAAIRECLWYPELPSTVATPFKLTTPADLRQALTTVSAASLPARMVSMDIDDYLQDGANRISPSAIRLLFFAVRESFVFQTQTDFGTLRSIPDEWTSNILPLTTFANAVLHFAKVAYPYGFDGASPLPSEKPISGTSTSSPPSSPPPPTKKRKHTHTKSDSEEEVTITVPPTTNPLAMATMYSVLAEHGCDGQFLDGPTVLAGLTHALSGHKARHDMDSIYDVCEKFLTKFVFQDGGNVPQDIEVSRALTKFQQSELRDPGKLKSNPAEVVGFIQDQLPSLKPIVDSLWKAMKSHKERAALVRTYSSKSSSSASYTGVDAADEAIDIMRNESQKKMDTLEKLIRDLKRDRNGGGSDTKSRDRDTKKKRNPIFSSLYEMVQKQCTKVDKKDLLRTTLSVLNGKCAKCQKAFDYNNPCCTTGKVHQDFVKKVAKLSPEGK